MNQDQLNQYAVMTVEQFAAAAPTLPFAVYASCCRSRLALMQGQTCPDYAKGYDNYLSMCQQAYTILCNRAAKGVNVR